MSKLDPNRPYFNEERVGGVVNKIGHLIFVGIVYIIIHSIITQIFKSLGQNQLQADQNASSVIWISVFIFLLWLVTT